jgi:hypothetical protein
VPTLSPTQSKAAGSDDSAATPSPAEQVPTPAPVLASVWPTVASPLPTTSTKEPVPSTNGPFDSEDDSHPPISNHPEQDPQTEDPSIPSSISRAPTFVLSLPPTAARSDTTANATGTTFARTVVLDGGRVSAAAITGIVLGASGLCIMGLVSSRRLFRRDQEETDASE